MSAAANTQALIRTGSSPLRCNLHFLIAAAFLALAAASWILLPPLLRVYLLKKPVPWPAQVQVAANDLRLLSLPDAFGPYEKVMEDGLLFEKRDGQPDGEIILADYDLEILGVGTGFDRSRYQQRSSNWYLSRVYRDGRPPAERPENSCDVWQLHVTYYSGAVDTVPHIPEVCLAASGATVVASDVVTLNVAGKAPGWSGQVKFCRTIYEETGPQGTWRGVQYYVFSLNGLPTHDWKAVRLKLASPFTRHAYFAKIQVAPRRALTDPRQADRQTEEFLSYALPEILSQIPTAADVELLKSVK